MIKIQKLYRGYKVRCTLDEMKMAAICIQKMLRGKWTRKLYAPLLKWTSTQDKVEEERKRRMERIRRNQRELYTLRNTPSQVLEEYYRIRRRNNVKRIQRWYRNVHGWKVKRRVVEEMEQPEEQPEDTFSIVYSTEEEDEDDEELKEYLNGLTSNNDTEMDRLRMQDVANVKLEEWKLQHDIENKVNLNRMERKSNIHKRYEKYLQLKHATQHRYHNLMNQKQEYDDMEHRILARVHRCNTIMQHLNDATPFEQVVAKLDNGDKQPLGELPESKIRLHYAKRAHVMKLQSLEAGKKWNAVFVDGQQKNIQNVHATSPWTMNHQLPENNNASAMECKQASKWWMAFAKSTDLQTENTQYTPTMDECRVIHEERIARIHENATIISSKILRNDHQAAQVVDIADETAVIQHFAAIKIQSIIRGFLGRIIYLNLQADRIATTSGAAQHKGLCEECGQQKSVLKCNECLETTQLCPNCWVHVHSTRRRRHHIAFPIMNMHGISSLQNNQRIDYMQSLTARTVQDQVKAALLYDDTIQPSSRQPESTIPIESTFPTTPAFLQSIDRSSSSVESESLFELNPSQVASNSNPIDFTFQPITSSLRPVDTNSLPTDSDLLPTSSELPIQLHPTHFINKDLPFKTIESATGLETGLESELVAESATRLAAETTTELAAKRATGLETELAAETAPGLESELVAETATGLEIESATELAPKPSIATKPVTKPVTKTEIKAEIGGATKPDELKMETNESVDKAGVDESKDVLLESLAKKGAIKRIQSRFRRYLSRKK